MIRTDDWHARAIEELQALLMPRHDVVAFALFGSALPANDKFDLWSDLDCLLVVKDEAYSRFYPATEWLGPFGELYTYQQSENIFYGILRACFVDFRRLDIVVTSPSRLMRLAEWTNVPFWGGVRLLFSRSDQITQIFSQALPLPELTVPSQSQFEAMANHFWFKAMLAGYKVIQDDRLIALHLALDLVRDCCVVGMMLRDRSEGKNVHRQGGLGNTFVAQLTGIRPSYTASGILDIIEQSAIQFDQFALQWSEAYREKRYPLIEWLRHIRYTASIGE